MRIASKSVVFAILFIMAVIFGILSFGYQPKFLEDIWSQLFWLTVGTIATTFVLQAILQHDLETRQRDEDSFAFRTFTANLLSFLLNIKGTNSELSDNLMQSAMFDKKKFAEFSKNIVERIISKGEIDGEIFNRHYLDISSGLRTLAENYIRLFSSNRQEMVQTYQKLMMLASKWTYKDPLSEDAQRYTLSLRVDDEDRKVREAERVEDLQEAARVIEETAKYLSELIDRSAKYRGMPPPP